jgi:hypothetical protein
LTLHSYQLLIIVGKSCTWPGGVDPMEKLWGMKDVGNIAVIFTVTGMKIRHLTRSIVEEEVSVPIVI